MSIIERIDSIHNDVAEANRGVFKKYRDEFLTIETPNDKQIAAFEKHLVKAEELQKKRDITEEQIIKHWDIYDSIINDPEYPQDAKGLKKSEERLRKGFATHTREGSSITSNTVGTAALKAVDSEVFVKLWNAHKEKGSSGSAGSKIPRKRAAPTGKLDVIRKKLNKLIPDIKLVIGTDPEVSAKVDELNAILKNEDGSFDEAKILYDQLEKIKPKEEKTRCKGEDCNSVNSPTKDGLCASCIKEKIDHQKDEIIRRHKAFKEENEEILFKRLPRNATDEEIEKANIEKAEIRKTLQDISFLRERYEESFHEFEMSKGKEGYQSCVNIYDELNHVLPSNLDKKKKKYSPYKDNNDEVIYSDESSAESSESSEYESDSSSSHEGQRMRQERAEKKKKSRVATSPSDSFTKEILHTFSKYPEIKELAETFESGDLDKFAKELKEIKDSMPRYKVNIVNKANNEPNNVFGDKIYYSEEDAQKRADELFSMLNKDHYSYKIEKC